MPTFVYMTRCDGCGHCVDICPSDIMHIDKTYRRAYNIEPNMCWECYSCVKACPQNAIDVRGYADFAPLGHSVRVQRQRHQEQSARSGQPTRAVRHRSQAHPELLTFPDHQHFNSRETTTMPTFVYMTRCDGCGHCVDICPSDIMHIDKVTRRAYNIEPNMCWECYSCVKACPQNAIDVRGYADFAPLGHSVRVLREEAKGTVSWKLKFRDGREKNFESPIRTTP